MPDVDRSSTAWALEVADGLAGGDETALEAALVYLEVDPWSFRSGYAKATMLRRLKHVALSDRDVDRVTAVLLRYVDVGPRWDFREACTAARVLASPALATELRQRLHGRDEDVALRALAMLIRLRGNALRPADLPRGQAVLLHKARSWTYLPLSMEQWVRRLWSPAWAAQLLAVADDRSNADSVAARRLLRLVPHMAERARAGP